jgi:uncharacterized RDD family membrane protein YckC
MNYSSFFRRFLGLLIDSVILGSISLVINRTIPMVGWVISLFLGFLYYPFFWSSTAKATPGKYLIGTVIVDLNGNRISIKTAFIRYFCSWISAALFCFGYLLCAFTEKKQTLHDLLAGTVALDEENKIEEGLFTAWINQIKDFTK